MARILVVDDDPDIRFVARLALKRGKHEVAVAESGRAALEHLDTGAACDLILCDWMMPEMSGIQTLAQVRTRPQRAGIPFVFLTAGFPPARGTKRASVRVVVVYRACVSCARGPRGRTCCVRLGGCHPRARPP